MTQPSSPLSPFHGFPAEELLTPVRRGNHRRVERWILASSNRPPSSSESTRPRSLSVGAVSRLEIVPEDTELSARQESLPYPLGIGPRRNTGESTAPTLEWELDSEEPSFVSDQRFQDVSDASQRGEGDVNTARSGTLGSIHNMEVEPQTLNKALQATARYMLIWDEELCDLDPEEMDNQHLRDKLNEIESLKTSAQEASSILLLQTDEVFSIDHRDKSATARRGILAFARRCSKVLNDRDVASRAETHAIANATSVRDKADEAAITIRAARVERHADSTLESARLVKSEVEAATRRAPQTDAEFRKTMDVLNHAVKRLTSVKNDIKSLLDDSVQAGLVAQADTLDAQLREIEEIERDLESNKTDWKINLGVFTSPGGKNVDIKPPQFSGSEDDKLDYYMFKTEWEDYASSKAATRNELLRLLTRTCLQGVARAACLHMETTEDVFRYLRDTYGNVNILFMTKVEDIRKLGSCTGSSVKKRDWAVNVRSQLTQLKIMAEKHEILEELYYSPVIAELQRSLPYKLLDDFKIMLRKKGVHKKPGIFRLFFEYLDVVVETFTFEVHYNMTNNETESKQSKAKDGTKHATSSGVKKAYTQVSVEEEDEPDPTFINAATYKVPEETNCRVCNGKHTYMFYCPKFVQARVRERVSVAGKQKCCFRCLRLDSNIDLKNRSGWQKNHEINCQTTWTCQEGACKDRDFPVQYHITMCTRHIEENKNREEEFVKNLDNKLIPLGTKFFTIFPSSYATAARATVTPVDEPALYGVIPDVDEPSIFMLQNIMINERSLLMFYDSGCMSASISSRASNILDTKVVRPGPTKMFVAGAQTVELTTGEEQFFLPLADGANTATLTALHMPEITHPFPLWELHEAWEEVQADFLTTYPGEPPLPPCPRQIGGRGVDIMIGIRYSMYWPVLMHMLPGGLGVYKSQFSAPNGEISILGGPHKAWRKATEAANLLGPRAYLTSEARAHFSQARDLRHLYVMPHADPGAEETEEPVIECEEGSLDHEEHYCARRHCKKHSGGNWIIPESWVLSTMIYSINDDIRRFLGSETIGSSSEYRCLRCRNCTSCQQGDSTEFISFREEAEQYVIEMSVTFNPELKRIIAKLPFVKNPAEFLTNNFYRASKILDGQIRKVSGSKQVRMDVITAHNKLYSKGYTIEVSKLGSDAQKLIEDATSGEYIIPWRFVHKESSLSTPVRIVFDASSVTPGGDCLNNCLGKGENRLCKILHILLRFRRFPYAFTCDIKMAYNGIELDPEHYRYQRYLWKEDLNPVNPLKMMVIRTLIYGVRSSGQQLLAGLNKLADYCEKNIPDCMEGAAALKSNTYVDDSLNSLETKSKMESTALSLVKVLGMAGLTVKDITMSGERPSEIVSSDEQHVGVVGMLWDSYKDDLKIDIKDLYFGKAQRGKLPCKVTGDVKEALTRVFTRRTLVGKVAGIFDPCGLLTPIVAPLKLDLQEICKLKLGWDDQIPEQLLDKWVRNLSIIDSCREIVFRRAVIPMDAANLSLEMFVSADSSQNVAVACVHTRVRRTDGSYCVQLLCAKSKLVSLLTVPKGELRAATMGASLGHIVRHNFGALITASTYITDSTITLFWMSQDERPLQTGVRNCVIEIRRLTALTNWRHIDSQNNVADIATRPVGVEDLKNEAEWICGKEWMRMPRDKMPLKTIQEIQLSGEEKRLAAVELKAADVQGIFLSELKGKVAERYKFSRYVLDPCRYRWEKVVRIMGLVLRFINLLRPQFEPDWRPPVPPTHISSYEEAKGQDWFSRWGENYFFFKGSHEVKEFMPKKDYVHCTAEKNGILLYTSRILDGQDIDDPENTMYDLQPLSFVKPVLDRYSPVAYSLLLYCHTVLSRHRSATTTLLESRGIAFVFKGRSLAIEIRENCIGCRRYKGKLLEAEMGHLHSNRLTVAPAFYCTQIDIFGPYMMICEHNHRSQVKAYGVVFKDPSTGAINIHTMQNYSTEAFLQAYTRHASRYGHPSKIYIDAGTQLVKACRDMELSEKDIIRNLEIKHGIGVDFSVCAVGAHNAQGVVERSIQEVKKLLKRVFSGIKVDLLSFETNLAWIANEMNNLPICLGSRTNDLDHLDIITPNRLILGRNNRRAMTGFARVSTPSRLINQMDQVHRSWWKIWRTEKLEHYIPQSPKWTRTSAQPVIGDIGHLPSDRKRSGIRGVNLECRESTRDRSISRWSYSISPYPVQECDGESVQEH